MSEDHRTSAMNSDLVTRIRALEKANAQIRHSQTQSRMVARQQKANQSRLLSKLTPRERQIAESLIAGKTVKQIAFDLERSVNTIHVHRARILKKTKAQDVPNLIRLFNSSIADPKAPLASNEML